MCWSKRWTNPSLIILFADDVAKLGVTVSYTPNGVTRRAFDRVLAAFPAPGKIIKEK